MTGYFLHTWESLGHQGDIILYVQHNATDLMYLEVVHMKEASYWRMDHPHSQFTQYFGKTLLLSFVWEQFYIY